MTNPDRRQAESGFRQTSFLPEPDFNPIYPTRTISRYFLPPKVIQAVFGGGTTL